jgi:hypothetical protein
VIAQFKVMGFVEIASAPYQCKRYCDFVCEGVSNCDPSYCKGANSLFIIIFGIIGIVIGSLQSISD